MGLKVLFASTLFVLAASLASPALGSTDLGSVELEGLVTKHAVRDRVIEDTTRATPARVEVFTDAHGHQITLGTDIPALDLSAYAGILGQTLHGAEIAEVFVEVVPWGLIELACGEGAVGCYFPAVSLIIVTDYDPRGVNELVHTIVHEYGHHVDRQLANLGHFDPGCIGRDGSRSWWWVRVPDQFRCYGVNWELLMGELYAEDYTAAHGIVGWHLSTIGPPSASAMALISSDFKTRFVPQRLIRAATVRRHRWVSWGFTVKHWTFLTATLRGPNRADLDLYLFRRGRHKPLKWDTRLTSSGRITYTLRPGAYELAVWADRSRGRASVRADIE